MGAAADAALPITFWNSGSCPFAQRAWIALEEKAVPYKFVKVDLSAKSADFVAAYASVSPASNPQAKVPAVQTADGYTMIESDVVAEYLCERFPEYGTPLMPSSAEQRARVRLFIATFDQTLGGALVSLLRAGGDEFFEELAALEGHLQTLNKFLRSHTDGDGKGPFLCGGLFSLAEVHAAPLVQRMFVTLPHFKGVNLRTLLKKLGLGRLRTWFDAVLARPSVVKTGVPEQDLIRSFEQMVKS